MISVGLFLTGNYIPGEPTALIGPSAPSVTILAGIGDGEVDIDVTDLPASWGDAVVREDGLGTLGTLEWWNPVDLWQTLNDPAAVEFFVMSLPIQYWGHTVQIKVRGRNAEGVAGTMVKTSVLIPGAEYQLNDLVIDTNSDDIPDGAVLDVELDPMFVYVEVG